MVLCAGGHAVKGRRVFCCYQSSNSITDGSADKSSCSTDGSVIKLTGFEPGFTVSRPASSAAQFTQVKAKVSGALPLNVMSKPVLLLTCTYVKKGSCALLAAIEPLTGKRLARVYEQRTKKEYALFFKELAAAYPGAEKIRVVQDNLNTHNASSFYEHRPGTPLHWHSDSSSTIHPSQPVG